MALSYSILYTRVTMYHVLRHSQGPTLSCQLGVTCETRACPRGAALDARRSRSVSACCDSGLRPRFVCFFFSFIAALALQKRGASAPRHIAVLAFFFFIFFFKKWSRRTFVRLPLSETTSRQEIFRDLNVTSATSTVILLFMRPPGISADALPLPTRTVGEVS